MGEPGNGPTILAQTPAHDVGRHGNGRGQTLTCERWARWPCCWLLLGPQCKAQGGFRAPFWKWLHVTNSDKEKTTHTHTPVTPVWTVSSHFGCLEHVTSRRTRLTECSVLTTRPLPPGEPKRGLHGLTAQSVNGSIELGTQVQSQDSCTLPCHAISTEPSEKGPTSSLSCCQVSRWFVGS